MATQQQLLSHCEPAGPVAILGHVARHLREAFHRSLERRRLYQELAQLDSRELADLRLQRHDIDLLVHGKSVPALECMGRSR